MFLWKRSRGGFKVRMRSRDSTAGFSLTWKNPTAMWTTKGTYTQLRRRCLKLLDSQMQLLTIQFEWHGLLKSVCTTLVGVSPEFEIPLYTPCFFAREEHIHVHVGPYAVNIKCYRFRVNKIASAFLIADNWWF